MRFFSTSVGRLFPRSHLANVVSSIRAALASRLRERPKTPSGHCQPRSKADWRRIRGIPEEIVDPGDEGDLGLAGVLLPMADTVHIDAQLCCDLPLEEAPVEARFANMIPQRL